MFMEYVRDEPWQATISSTKPTHGTTRGYMPLGNVPNPQNTGIRRIHENFKIQKERERLTPDIQKQIHHNIRQVGPEIRERHHYGTP